jgi:hypothetical protein
MEVEKKTGLQRLLSIDRRFIFLVLIILTTWGLVAPIGLPIKVERSTQKMYDVIDALPPGSVVLCSFDAYPGLWGEMGAVEIALMYQLWENPNIRWIDVQWNQPASQTQLEYAFTLIDKEIFDSRKYGEDWVHIGYIEGHETAQATFAENLWFTGVDAYGNKFEDLPLMQEAHTIEEDIDLIIHVGGGGIIEVMRQLGPPHNTPTVTGIMSMCVPDVLPWYETGDIIGFAPGLPGGAQYEFLTGHPGVALPSQDALSFSHIFLLILMLATNTLYLIARSRGEHV